MRNFKLFEVNFKDEEEGKKPKKLEETYSEPEIKEIEPNREVEKNIFPAAVEIEYRKDNFKIPTSAPIEMQISEKILKAIEDFMNKLSKVTGTAVNRARVDLVILKDGSVKMYEANATNPLGLGILWEMYQNFIEENDDDPEVEERNDKYKREIDKIEKTVLSIFKEKIPVFATCNERPSCTIEVPILSKILEKYNHPYQPMLVDYKNSEELKKYIGNEGAMIWWAGGLGKNVPEDLLAPLAEASNVYGGKPKVDDKKHLTTENFPDNPLIIEAESYPATGDFSVLPGYVAKETSGAGGKDVHIAIEKGVEVSVKKGEEYLFQKLVNPEGVITDLDLTIIKTPDGGIETFAFRRYNPEDPNGAANVSAGGTLQPVILLRFVSKNKV